jgi:GNAT superfamily N-acetyltransferase
MRLRTATADEQRARDGLCASVWGGGLTVEQFVEREARLRSHWWPRAVMRSWLWEADDGAVLASCETFALESQVGPARGHAHLIASVFTEPRYRGRGYASAMLHALAAWSRADGAQAMVLFSEVGPALYQALGFRPVPSFDVVLPASAGASAPAAASFETVWPPAANGELRLARTAGQLEWHLERERYYAEVMGRPRPTASGARLGGASIGWTAYFKSNELQVLWVDASERAALLALACAEAARLGLSQVRVWDEGDGGWAAALPGAKVVPRDDEVPMFLPFSAELQRWSAIERAMWG